MTDKSFLLIDEEIKRLQKEDFKLNITKLLIKGDTFVGLTLYGEKRVGKSVCALISLYEVYKNWDEVFKHIFFSIKDLIAFLMKCAKEDIKCPAILFDDASVGAGAQMYHTNRVLVHYMGAVFDVIGTVLKGIILTTPDSENLIKSIRRANFYKCQVVLGKNKYDRIARIYKPMRTPYEQFRLQKVAIDNFDVRLPVEIYQRYYQIRRTYSISALEDIDTFINSSSGEHIDYDVDNTNRLDYQRQYHRDYRKGKRRIHKADWDRDINEI